MNTVKVKICGIRRLESALVSVEAGADFLGFNFVKGSKRFITSGRAKEIINELNNYYLCHYKDRRPWFAMTNRPKLVGIFKNENIKRVNERIKLLKLDYVQLHGDELPEYISHIKEAGIIKTFSLSPNFDVQETIKAMKKYKIDYFLLDREVQGRGKLLNLDKVRQLTAVFPVFLAGGLTADNVTRSIQRAQPYAVDVASGIETKDREDLEKITGFIISVKNIYKSMCGRI